MPTSSRPGPVRKGQRPRASCVLLPQPCSASELRKAIDYYQQAIREDPSFAETYAWLADAYVILAVFEPAGDWMRVEAVRLAEKALELDGSVATAYVTLGILRRGNDLAGAEAAFKKALEVDPHHVNAHKEYALFLFRDRGIFDEALAELQQALQLDPLAWQLYAHLAEFHRSNGRPDSSLEACRRAMELAPTWVWGYFNTGHVYLALGEYDQAEYWARKANAIIETLPADWLLGLSSLCQGRMDQAVEFSTRRIDLHSGRGVPQAGVAFLWAGNEAKAREYLERAVRNAPGLRNPLWPTVWHYAIVLGYLEWKAGERSEAERILENILHRLEPGKIDNGSEQPTSSRLYDIALIHAIRNDREEAYRWLERAMNAGWNYVDIALREPIWSEYREDPQFQGLTDRMRARVDSMRKRIRIMEAE